MKVVTVKNDITPFQQDESLLWQLETLISCPNIKEKGVAPVVTCEVDLYAVSDVTNSEHQFFSTFMIWRHLSRESF